MSTFIGGKLKFKNAKANMTTLKIKQQILNSTNKQVNNTIKNDKEEEILNEVKNSISSYCVVPHSNDLDLVNIGNNNEYKSIKSNENSQKVIDNNIVKLNLNIKEKDTRTLAEKKFDEMRLKKLPIVVNKEIKGYKKELKDKFTKILDKQTDHYDIPKVGTGN